VFFLKETELAQSIQDWQEDEDWAMGALILIPLKRLSADRKFLVRKVMQSRDDAQPDTLLAVVEWHQVELLRAQGMTPMIDKQVNFDSEPDLVIQAASDHELQLVGLAEKYNAGDESETDDETAEPQDCESRKSKSTHRSRRSQTPSWPTDVSGFN